MTVNFVTEPKDKTWILRRWCKGWQKHIPGSSILTTASPTADANIYVNYALFHEKTKCDIGYFTHREEVQPHKDRFNKVAKEVDWCIAQSKVTARLLPKNKTSIIRPAIGEQFIRNRIRIGIVSRRYNYTDRKRLEWIDKLKEIKHFGQFEFVFTDDSIVYEAMPIFYKSLDYVLVTSKIEGGPMCVPEALAMGKPIITPYDVGWCDEFTTLKYNTFNDLVKLLKGLLLLDSWESGAKKIIKLVKSLTKC